MTDSTVIQSFCEPWYGLNIKEEQMADTELDPTSHLLFCLVQVTEGTREAPPFVCWGFNF